mgnify:CR=1 FL=1
MSPSSPANRPNPGSARGGDWPRVRLHAVSGTGGTGKTTVAAALARHDYEKDAVVRCSGTGSACILIHRSVFERLGPAPYEPLRNPTTGDLIGEDLSFCARAAQADIPIHVHTGVPTSHLKPIWMGEAQFAMWPRS